MEPVNATGLTSDVRSVDSETRNTQVMDGFAPPNAVVPIGHHGRTVAYLVPGGNSAGELHLPN